MQLFGGGVRYLTEKDIINPNLLKGTANFDPKFWGELQLSGKDYLGNDQFEATTAWFGPHETINVRSGDVITISGIVKLNIDACQIGIPAGDTKYNDTAVVVTRSPQVFVDGQSRGTGYINITDQNYHVLSATYTVTQGGTLNPRFESSSDQPNFLLSSMKAEYGSVATAWCPAYADYAMQASLMNYLLSGQSQTYVDDSFDLNSAGIGVYRSWGKIPKNAPNGITAWCLYMVGYFSESEGSKFEIALDGSGNICYRTLVGAPLTWSPWRKITTTDAK